MCFPPCWSWCFALLLVLGASPAWAADVLYLDPAGNPESHGIQIWRGVYDRHVRTKHPQATYEHRIVPMDTPEITAQAIRPDRMKPPRLIFTADSRIAQAVSRELPGIPMVFLTLADPMMLGVVDDPIAPRNNVTGYTNYTPFELKHIEILQECVPSIRRVGVLSDASWATAMTPRQLLAESESLFGVSARLVSFQSPEDLARLPQIAAAERFDAWFVPDTPFTRNFYREIAAQIRSTGKPWIAGNRQPTALLVYTPERFDPWQRVAEMVSLVLSGVPAREIPFGRPKKFELIVNRTTAHALGIQVPKSILMRAHDVID